MSQESRESGLGMGGSCCPPTPPFSEFTSDPGSFVSVPRVSILGFLLSKVTMLAISSLSSVPFPVLTLYRCPVGIGVYNSQPV